MPTWKAYFQINGYDFTRYPVIDFPVPESVYKQIQTSLAENRPLRDCPFYGDLLLMACEALDLDQYRPEYADLFPEFAEVFVESCIIDDPGDPKRLKDRFVGRRLPDHPIPSEFENEDCTFRYSLLLSLDDDGIVTDVQVFCEGMESESVNASSFSACYPDYAFITSELEKEFDLQ